MRERVIDREKFHIRLLNVLRRNGALSQVRIGRRERSISRGEIWIEADGLLKRTGSLPEKLGAMECLTTLHSSRFCAKIRAVLVYVRN